MHYNADLHIHSPYSIAVSQNLNLNTMNETATKKGLKILGTGDITQPNWRKYLRENLTYENGQYSYKKLYFIFQTELEDIESIHHLVLLPDFNAAEKLTEKLQPFVKNINGRWAGRPHVNRSPAELVEIIEDVGGISGPAHAFTPFKSIFRQNKFRTLEDAYCTAAKKVKFLELGLSADTNLADRIESLQDITFLSNSDAHSEGFQSLGREFNRFEIDNPSFDEMKKAIERRGSRKITLNVGLEPRLGKYYIMFCKKCRRRIQRTILSSSDSEDSKLTFGFPRPIIDDEFIGYHFKDLNQEQAFLKQTSKNFVECPVCALEIRNQQGKKRNKIFPKLNLGVSERINEIATYDLPIHPNHRPPYLGIIPLVEILRTVYNVKNPNSITVKKAYEKTIETIGTEFDILVDISIEHINQGPIEKLGMIIQAFREKKIEFIPGGGGTFGKISFD